MASETETLLSFYATELGRQRARVAALEGECRTLWRAVGDALAGLAAAEVRLSDAYSAADPDSTAGVMADAGFEAAHDAMERVDALLDGLVRLTPVPA